MGFFFSCLRRDVQNSCLQCAGRPEGLLASKATEMSAPSSAQRRPAPPSALRPDPPVVCLGFGLDRLHHASCQIKNLFAACVIDHGNCRTSAPPPKPLNWLFMCMRMQACCLRQRTGKSPLFMLTPSCWLPDFVTRLLEGRSIRKAII